MRSSSTQTNPTASLILLAVALASFFFSSLSCQPAQSKLDLSSLNRAGVSETVTPDNAQVIAGQTLYVPSYSHVLTADGASPLNVASTLFVRNTDRSHSIVLTQVEYFDSSGKSLRSMLKSPLKIEPMASIDFFVKESDETGGASPSFLVDWVAVEPVSDPIAETVMIGTTGSQGISFVCSSRVVKSRSNPVAPTQDVRK